MPIYEYRCVDDESHAKLEVTRSINDPEQPYECKECESLMVRNFTPFGIQFKGNGFYKTDNPK
jgi:putative FmdB family regulatory protein